MEMIPEAVTELPQFVKIGGAGGLSALGFWLVSAIVRKWAIKESSEAAIHVAEVRLYEKLRGELDRLYSINKMLQDELSQLRSQNTDLLQENVSLRAEVRHLSAQIEALQNVGRV